MCKALPVSVCKGCVVKLRLHETKACDVWSCFCGLRCSEEIGTPRGYVQSPAPHRMSSYSNGTLLRQSQWKATGFVRGMVVAPTGINNAGAPPAIRKELNMKPQVANNPYHNPFYNRFNDPCRQRLDDMQSHEYTLWLGERSRAMSLSMPVIPKTENTSESHRARALMSLAILLGVGVLISAAFLFR